MITLALNNNRISEMENSSFSGLGLLERPSKSMLPLETMLVSKICATLEKHVGGIPGPCCHSKPCQCLRSCGCLWTVLPPGAMLISVVLLLGARRGVCAATETMLMCLAYATYSKLLSIYGPCCHQRPC